MTYAIGTFIYGWDLTDPDDSIADAYFEVPEETHFSSAYSGNGEQPRWFGATLGEIDECETLTLAQVNQRAEITAEKQTDFETRLAALIEDEDVPQVLKDYFASTPPQILLLWGSS